MKRTQSDWHHSLRDRFLLLSQRHARIAMGCGVAFLVGCGGKDYLCDAKPVQAGQCTTFWVDARKPWNPTNIEARRDERYTFVVGPSVPPWKDWIIDSDPEFGWSWRRLGRLMQRNARTTSAPMYSLVCAVGRVEEDAWVVASNAIVAPARTREGSVECYANDWPSSFAYGNNSGCLRVVACRDL